MPIKLFGLRQRPSAAQKSTVLLVSPDDTPSGVWDKWDAHRLNLLHRAYSILIFNRAGQLLLQRRANAKYHSGGLWSNTCCGHPGPNVTTRESAKARLMYEMSIQTELAFLCKCRYQVTFADGLHEHEWNHVFVGVTNDRPDINPEEVSAYRWIDWPTLLDELRDQPEQFTYWFHKMMELPDIQDFVIEYTRN